MDQNIMTHYIVDANGSSLPVPTTTSSSPTGVVGGMIPLTPNAFTRQQTLSFSQVPQRGGQGQNPLETHVTIINFEQCCICSIMYEQRRPGPVPQPDLNRMVSKVLDVVPPLEAQFFRSYLPFCDSCTELLRKFDKLRVELEFVKTQLVTYVVESLTQVRAEGGSQLEGLKDQILSRWTDVTPNGGKRGKKGFSATASTDGRSGSGDLSWAVYNNIAKGGTVVEPIEDWNVGSEVTVEAAGTVFPQDCNDSDNDNLDGAGNASDNDDDDDSQSVTYGATSNIDPTTDPLMMMHPQDNDAEPVVEDKIELVRVTTSSKSIKGRRKLKQIKRITGKVDLEVAPLICSNCGRTYGSMKTYNAHAQVCNTDDLNLEKICTVCTEELQVPCIFETWNDFKEHVLQRHPLVKLEVCQFCRLRFLPFGIKHHKCIQIYKGQLDQEAIFKCDQCGRAYNFRANLTDHVRRSHNDQKHTCSMCGKTYGSPMLLKFHVERHTSVVTKFKCDVCGVCLSSNYSLKEHSKRHTGEQPYHCTICDKRFSSKTIFTAHQMVHRDDKPHTCVKCGKEFKLRGTMRRHLSRHLVYETNYTKKCPLCPNSAFRKVWILKKHMLAQHPGTAEHEAVLEKYKDVDDTPPSAIAKTKSGKGTRSSEFSATSTEVKIETNEASKTELVSPSKSGNSSSPPGSPPARHSARLMKKTASAKRFVAKVPKAGNKTPSARNKL